FIIFILIFRNLILSILAMIPNIIPIALNIVIMAISGIPLNVATVMIASISIGISVDDTIHFIVRYWQEYPISRDVKGAIKSTLQHVGRPVIFTTLINMIGFSVLMLSDFMPIKYFGLLMVFTLLSALIADLVLLPVILIIGEKWMSG
ncbi:MAG: hypothetical protein D6828_05570, partial [Nitrospirae bacterium]